MTELGLQFADLLPALAYLGEDDVALLRRAYLVAEQAHEGQKRLSGEPYLSHPLAVTKLLAEMRLDTDALAAALLHDVVEDTAVTSEEIRAEFGSTVEKLVEGVTKLGRIKLHSQAQIQAENIRKMLIAMAEDLRVVLIKLADRLHNMRTIAALPEERQRRIAQETMDIYAPLAHRLGMWQMKAELEDLSFSVLDQENYERVRQEILSQRRQRETALDQARRRLGEELELAGIPAEVVGRPKNITSVFRKMQQGGRTIGEIYDLVALRVICDDIRGCYGALGVVHSLWKPIPGRFKDYVAMPKGNGYQSLHTTVVGEGAEPVEIQIRTWDMHRTAEEGIAAHWHYKEGTQANHRLDQGFGWLRSLLEWQKELLDAESFVEHVKLDVFQDEVFVFTPKGDVLSLPSGSTAIDFAYRIHTDVGHRCLGAKANSRMVPLDYRLQNGDIVEVLTTRSERHGPSRDWLNFAKTSSAREKIRQWFKRERREENVTRGKELLDRELRRMRGSQLSAIPPTRLQELGREFRIPDLTDFFAAIGYGEIAARTVVLRWAAGEEAAVGQSASAPSIPLVSRPTPSGGVRVSGLGDLLTNIARCCKPVPGEPIRGYVTRGRGVTVHRDECVNIRHAGDPRRIVEVEWDADSRQVYPVRLRIEGRDRTGLLRDVATAIAESKVNLSGAAVEVEGDHTAVISTVVEVSSLTELSRLLERLEGVRDVQQVTREVG
ncbi:MAG TPA: bifunctional (p)ppGpp synthetase/guanosine-3',5'-bis(diphosphate) 3'-pyrophosphohydrolase [Candidatus Nanopelagicaceae bacterium]|nr:bifunctional (p)ppGpp synthetase/guanosine-3',5'-bis(diphosphate) 3'-pyrophosphohydrolase [Candidatus Nanopelagicaceae bacterium]